MLTLDEAGIMLEEIVESIPREFFDDLNGGVNLLPGVKPHPLGGGLLIMGEYHNDPRGLGRYINIYFGSFMKAYANHSTELQKDELRRVLLHEFTHHLESLAGERGLEIKDALELDRLRRV